ncbi:C-Myc-binding protein isoform X2 [Pan paniscus]|uniref:C-Myc-binding protein isoform X2 n=1 Tax=Pan paniscus TaxID=9597 RepID=UPI0006C99617|nr:C-Myc-binding protein isoform X2 [Pan paniscus]XP_016815061.1 C-Myc-binding protein isoform X2 [Pan troglodytes]
MSSAAPNPPVAVSGASYAAAAVTMAHYKAADSKREQFRRYLEKSGVLDTLTKAAAVDMFAKDLQIPIPPTLRFLWSPQNLVKKVSLQQRATGKMTEFPSGL